MRPGSLAIMAILLVSGLVGALLPTAAAPHADVTAVAPSEGTEAAVAAQILPAWPEANPMRKALYRHGARAYPNERIPPGVLFRARQQLAAGVRSGALPAAPQLADGATLPRAAQTPGVVVESAWSSIGPRPIVSTPYGEMPPNLPWSGHVSAIAVDPRYAQNSTVYLGAESGGVWRSRDGGANWTPVTDGQLSLGVAAVTVDPNVPDTVYVGLGEPNFNLDSPDGYGVLKSTDNGASWALSPLPPADITTCFSSAPPAACQFFGTSVARIAVDPNSPTTCQGSCTLYAATSISGIARSADGGLSWTLAPLFQNSQGAGSCVSDVVIDGSTNPSTVYALQSGSCTGGAGAGVYRTTANLPNVAANWTYLPGSAANPFPTSRTGWTRLSLGGTSPATLYALISDLPGSFLGVYKTTNGGQDWTNATGNLGTVCAPANSWNTCPSWYNLEFGVWPANPQIVYVAGEDLFKSTDGGSIWTNVTTVATNEKAHVDQHGFAFIPGSNGQGFFLGNDGGIFRSTDGGNTVLSMNQTLDVVQFYRGAVHPTNPNIVFAGSQDNGSLAYTGQLGWAMMVGGDDGYVAFDYRDPDIVYTTLPIGAATERRSLVMKSTAGLTPTAFQPAFHTTPVVSQEQVNREQVIAPLVMDPFDPKTLYFGVGSQTYRTTDAAHSWQPLGPTVLPTLSISALAVGVQLPPTPTATPVGQATPTATPVGQATPTPTPTALRTVYVGTSQLWCSNCPLAAIGRGLMVSTDGGASYVDRSGSLPNRFIQHLAVHPRDPNTAYVAFSGFATVDSSAAIGGARCGPPIVDAGHIYKTTDGGRCWTDVSGSLPNAPANAVLIDPRRPDTVYVATDVGVFKSTTGGGGWTALNQGLPNVTVNDLGLSGDGSKLYAFTWGRGAWVTTRSGDLGLAPPTPTATPHPATQTAIALTLTRTPTPTPRPGGAGTLPLFPPLGGPFIGPGGPLGGPPLLPPPPPPALLPPPLLPPAPAPAPDAQLRPDDPARAAGVPMIPEAGSLALLAGGLGAVALLAWRRARAARR